jgi:hypothetical protein
MTTQIDSAIFQIPFSISALAASTTLTTGQQSNQVQNSAGYVDALVTVLPILAGVTAPVVGQYMGLWVAGQNTSFVTNPIAGINGVDGAAVLTNASTLNSLTPIRPATVTVATGGLLYYFQPFSVAQLFGGIMPQFWTMYMAHNLSAALGTNTNRFSYNGITY